MAMIYKKLWKLLIDKYMSNKDRKEVPAASHNEATIETKPLVEPTPITPETNLAGSPILTTETSSTGETIAQDIVPAMQTLEITEPSQTDITVEYFCPSDSVKSLGLSCRSINVLCRNGFFTVEQLMCITPEQLRAMHGVGQKTIDEILSFIQTVEVLPEGSSNLNHAEFHDKDGILREDIPIEALGLSVRAINCLIHADIKFASQLIDATIEDLLSMQNMGGLTAAQILNKMQTVSFKFAESLDVQESSFISGQFCSEIVKRLKEFLSFPSIEVSDDLLDVYNEFAINDCELVENKDIWIRIFAIPIIRNALKAKIVEVCEGSFYGISHAKISASLPPEAVSCGSFDIALEELFVNNQIWTTPDDTIARKYPSILEYAKSVSDAKVDSFLWDRLNGLTLEEIGHKSRVTRERVRQVVRKNLQKRPVVAEDRYIEVYRTYNWSCATFSQAFGEPKSTYNYLYAAYGKCGSKDLEDLCANVDFPRSFRDAAERVICNSCITVGNEYIPVKRLELIDFVLRTYCNDEMTFDDFIKLYNSLLSEWGLDRNPLLVINEGTYMNRFAESKNVLWKYGKRFRYYDSEQYDFAELFETLSLDQYHNVEYSTLKFFREHSEIMLQYDIRDEYELHNLLRTICTHDQYPELQFRRMPNMEFGVADRDAQVLNLLLWLAPISAYDFSKRYEQEYGVLSQTVLANYVACLDKFFLMTIPLKHK
jgi:hypothetical protein